MALLEVTELAVTFARKGEREVRAVDGVSFTIRRGETLGIVGESGCGKSTLARMLVGLEVPDSGTIRFRGRDVTAGNRDDRRWMSQGVQMVFQDPYASLDPRMTVLEIVSEPLVATGRLRRGDRRQRVGELLSLVGLSPELMERYPHQFSGGQRQRIGIARALAVRPEFLVADEAVAALDVSIQAQVLNLFLDLREALNLTYLFISHDLAVVELISDRVAIMYLGRIVELAPTPEFFAAPNHPYARALLAEAPRLDRRRSPHTPIKGEIPSPLNPPPGCHFHPRCPFAFDRCRVDRPALKAIAPGRWSACHLNDGTEP